MLENGEPLLARIPFRQTAGYYQVVADKGVQFYTGPSFDFPFYEGGSDEQTMAPSKTYVSACCSVTNQDGVDWVFTTGDEMEQGRWLPLHQLSTGKKWLKELPPTSGMQLYRVTEAANEQPFLSRPIHGAGAPGSEKAKEGMLIASRLEVRITHLSEVIG